MMLFLSGEEKKRKLQAVIPLEVILTMFPSLGRAKGEKSGVGFFSSSSFFWAEEKMLLTLDSHLLLFITGVKGWLIFMGRAADILISAKHCFSTLMSTPVIFPKKGGMWYVSGCYVQYLLYSSLAVIFLIYRQGRPQKCQTEQKLT